MLLKQKKIKFVLNFGFNTHTLCSLRHTNTDITQRKKEINGNIGCVYLFMFDCVSHFFCSFLLLYVHTRAYTHISTYDHICLH